MKELAALLGGFFLLGIVACTTIPKDRTIELPTRQYIQQQVIEDGKVRVLTCHWEDE